MKLARVLALIVATLVACHDHDNEQEEHGHDHAAQAFTTFGERAELFIEIPTLVVGEPVSPAAHVTALDGYTAAKEGKVVVELTGGGAPTERFEAGPAEPGIFRPAVKPAHAATREISVTIESGSIDETHRLGEMVVYPSDDAVKAAEEPEEEGGISFLKEQQWKMDFAVRPVERRPLRPSFEAYGTLVPRAGGAVDVTAPISGRLDVDATFPHVGLDVAPGAVLGRLDPRLDAQADIPALEAAVVEARIVLDQAERDRQRLEHLGSESAVPERRLLDARSAEKRAKTQLTAAQRRLLQARRFASGSPGKAPSGMSILSPIEGTVVGVAATPGSVVESGQLLFRVVDLDRLWLKVHVAEAHVGILAAPKGVWFTLEGIDAPFEVGAEGVVGTGGEIDEHTRTVPLLVAIENPEERLRVGMFAQVHVITGEAREVVAVPVSAIVRSGATPLVFVQRGGESFERVQVRLGVRDGEWIEIVEGLETGQRVVTRGAYAVHLAASATGLPEHGHQH